MGVIGLWGLLEPAGKPVPLESLENKILAVDVSIWLNQAVKGYRDREGNAVANAHLLGLFHRISKLLFYKIKPVFVFDGRAPDLKKETLQRRRIRKGDASKKARVASAKILDNYVRSQVVAGQLQQQTHAINKVLSKGPEGLQEVLNNRTQKRDKDLFELPPMPDDHAAILVDSDSDSSDEEFKDDLLRQLNAEDIHSMDVSSPQFAALPKEMQYEVLHELTERRKQSSWNKMNEMPKSGSGFSGFQMQRLINRSKVQKAKDSVSKEMGEDSALQLDANLFVGDINGLKKAKAEAKKVASSASGTHYLYISDLKKAQENNDDEVEILEPVVITSNRVGGSMSVKKEIIEEDYQEEVIDQSKNLMPSTSAACMASESNVEFEEVSEVGHMEESESSSDDGDFEEVEPNTNALEIEIRPSKTLEKDDDLFADVFDNFEPVSEKPSKIPADTEVVPVPVNEDPTENMAEKMKQSDHLYLKIAAKYVEPATASTSAKEDKVKNDHIFDELDEETEKLLAEMKTKTREQRLMKIKDLDKMQAEETNKIKAPKADKKTHDILTNLGVERMDQEDYTYNVMKESNLEEVQESDQVFGDAAEGFVRSDRDSGVLNSSRAEILEKCDKEGEEFDREELMQLQQQLAEEQQGLIAERGQLDRLAASVTDQMYGECQELLQLFGIPWLVAPSEAEAQCAFLDMNGLTHGTITDDSDVWVFGGQRVYKNFFNQDKHCEYFTAADVDKHFGLSREKLILLAMLTGSDYTDGIESVGPVTALEILAEFPGQGIEPLKVFKDWWNQIHKNPAMPPGKCFKIGGLILLNVKLFSLQGAKPERK